MTSNTLLYKYLDVQGAAGMLYNGSLQFTNATKLNDPFDCHPGLVRDAKELYDVPVEIITELVKAGVRIGELGYHPSFFRDITYVCSLSKNFGSILMWSYYTKNHKGVCVGLDMRKLNQHIPFIDFDVKYPETLTKYNWAAGTSMEAFKHQLATKAPEWKHENEVRLLDMPKIGYADIGFYPEILLDNDSHRQYKIGGECFTSIYLGVNIGRDKKEEIIKLAQQRNPDIKIYQMRIDPDALKLDAVEVVA